MYQLQPIDGELRQYHPLKKSSIRRQTPNGLATNSSYGLPESFRFQEIVYKDNVRPLCGFHRLPVAVVGRDLPEEERIQLVKAQSEQFLHKHKSWCYEQEVRVSITPRAAWLFGDSIELSALERLFYYEPTQLVGVIFGARMPIENRTRLIEVLLYRQDLLYRSANHKRIIFDFAVFDAHLSGKDREIQTEISQMIVSGHAINKSDEKFQSAFDRWKNGWGIEFEGTRATKVQVLG